MVDENTHALTVTDNYANKRSAKKADGLCFLQSAAI